MITIYSMKKLSSLLLLTALSGALTAQGNQNEIPGLEIDSDSLKNPDKSINLSFTKIDKDRITGSVNYIDADS